MKFYICILALTITVATGSFLHHTDEASHADIHIESVPLVTVDEHTHVASAPAAKVVHHDTIHKEDPVHHITKVVHHQPHHILHYTNRVVDHHIEGTSHSHSPVVYHSQESPAIYNHHHSSVVVPNSHYHTYPAHGSYSHGHYHTHAHEHSLPYIKKYKVVEKIF
ncbi:hypothetical protein ACFFRR_009653 [Megaselia abdita]